jgi:CRISPR-associated exonuclease Cas4
MTWGREAEEALRRKETRRKLRRYGLDEAKRVFGMMLEDRAASVSGVCDLVLCVGERVEWWPRFAKGLPEGVRGVEKRVGAKAFPVEVKRTLGGVGRHHVLQLAGYAELLERSGRGQVECGFVLLLPEDRVERVVLGADERAAFWQAVQAIRTMAERERFPPRTRHRRYCADCEFVNYCGDVAG